MVAVYKIDLDAIGAEPLASCVAVFGDAPFDPHAVNGLTDVALHRVNDLAALDRLAAQATVDAVVAGSCAGLTEATSRLGARLIVVAPELPEALVDAVGRGVDARWAPDAAAVVAELSRLRAARRPDATRHRLDDVRLHWSGAAVTGRVHDLSNWGVAFEVTDADLERLLPGSVLEGVRLTRRAQPCLEDVRVIVRHVAPLKAAGRYLVGCAWKPRAATADVAATPIRDRALSAALVKSGLAAGVVIAPLDDDARDGGAMVLVGGHVDAARGTMTAEADGSFVEHDLVRGHFELGGSLYRFTSVVIATAPLTIKLPAVLAETQQRAAARHRPRADEPITVELRSPFNETTTSRPVVDLSATGLSFLIDGAHDLFPVGLALGVRLALPDGPLDCTGHVRTLVRQGSRLRAGIELSGLDEPQAMRLANFVMRLRYPVVDDGSDVSVEELLEFFRATGFLYPAKEELLAPIMPEVRETFARSYAQPSDVFKAVVARDNGTLVGHVSGIRAYRHTWMPTHLAALPTKHVGHLLNLGAADYFLQTADFEFFKIYFHADSKWPARIFGGFARMQRDATQSHLRGYRHIIVSTDAPLQPSPLGIDVLEASPDDLAVVERHFVTREPGLIMRADDLTRQTLQLSELNKSFSAIGLYRRRRVLLAMRRNVCLGFALVEVSSAGLNLSEALSAFQIFVTDEGHAEDEAVRRALVNAVLPIYRNAGRGQARGLIAPADVAAYERMGFAVNEEQWMCWTYHRRLCPRFCDYVDRVFEVLRKRQKRA